MKVSEPEERPERVGWLEYHGVESQNSNSENVQDKSWSLIQDFSLAVGVRRVGQRRYISNKMAT
ncbi:hypothetical protein CRU79_02530 [Escherichia sp. E4385]|nr:hypothetical protein CRI66_12855 [Escherichia sp. E4694]TGC19111.1 hypothetical protein CRU79_02530 [Escherichia sp. E4385]